MKNYLLFLILVFTLGCTTTELTQDPVVEKIILDPADPDYGYYLSVKPKGVIKTVLVLLPGFGQSSENIFLDTDFHKIGYEKNMGVMAFSGRMRITADSVFQEKFKEVLNHIRQETGIGEDRFVLGGFSAGGVIALRYTELCHQYPDKYPIQPPAVFMADAPVDLFHSWTLQEENLKNNYSEISVNEAKFLTKYYQENYGATPTENPALFMRLTPFSIDQKYGNNEQFLKTVAVRAYHDIDVAWRLKYRNQTARYDNYVATSELINRLLLMGNEKAEFIQTFQTGYRTNGERHPHSWSIVDETECVEWITQLLK